ncbi:MAG: hypothetical protein AAF488_17045, partial [Planctomycetota bacterium]
MDGAGKCPMGGGARRTATGTVANRHWWPNQLNLKVLSQHSPMTDPMGELVGPPVSVRDGAGCGAPRSSAHRALACA